LLRLILQSLQELPCDETPSLPDWWFVPMTSLFSVRRFARFWFGARFGVTPIFQAKILYFFESRSVV